MRKILGGIIVGLTVLVLCLCMAWAMLDTQSHGQLRNQYWPFSVEMQIRDR